MSRIGKQPVKIADNVAVSIDGDVINVNGPKGSLTTPILSGLRIKIVEELVVVKRENELAVTRANHGLMRSLISNMVIGVSEGFSKQLEINGVGYRVNMTGQDLKFNIGFSHDVNYKMPEGVSAKVDQNIITISGIDKQQVGQVSAEIRSLKKPEPYKGKGIQYVGERIIRKSGKSGKE